MSENELRRALVRLLSFSASDDLRDRIERGLRRLPGIGEKKIALVLAVVREEFEKVHGERR